MLFVLAARREAPARLLSINARGVPIWSILASTIVGFACVVAAASAAKTVFLFLLNSSGAIILFAGRQRVRSTRGATQPRSVCARTDVRAIASEGIVR
jgi:amino acid permease-like protein